MEKSIFKGKIRLKIGNKIFGGFLILIILFIANAAIIFGTGNKIDSVVKNSSESIRPSKDAINEFILMVTQSKMLITNWVYLPTNSDDKQALRQIKEFDFPSLKEKITKLMPLWQDSQRIMMDTVFQNFDVMMKLAWLGSTGQPMCVSSAERRVRSERTFSHIPLAYS